MTNQIQLWKMMVAEAVLTATANEMRSREFVLKRKGVASESGSHLTLAMAQDTGMSVNAISQGHAGSATAIQFGSF